MGKRDGVGNALEARTPALARPTRPGRRGPPRPVHSAPAAAAARRPVSAAGGARRARPAGDAEVARDGLNVAAPAPAHLRRRRVATGPASGSDADADTDGSGGEAGPSDGEGPSSASGSESEDSHPPGGDSDGDDPSDGGWGTSGSDGDGGEAGGGAQGPVQPQAVTRAGSGDDSDSSEGGRPNRNTIGDVPLEWYRPEPHVGYDVDGNRIARGPRRDGVDALLARADSGAALRTIYDEYNGEEIVLTREELRLVKNIRAGRFPHVEVDPFDAETHWFTGDVEKHPINAAPEPKRRFMPSKWEEKAVVKLVRALRRGWIKPRAERAAAAGSDDEGPLYMMWADDGNAAGEGGGGGAGYVPAPKPRMPGHEQSYNPPAEYLPGGDAEPAAGDSAFVPRAFSCLRAVPAYSEFVRERFERCLDLYLCPRVKKKAPFVKDAATLLPSLPSPADLRPYPRTLHARWSPSAGGVAPLRAVCLDPAGQWVAAAGDGGVVTVWDVATGREAGRATLGARVAALAWRPGAAGRAAPLLAAAAGDAVVLLPPPGVGTAAQRGAAADTLAAALAAAPAAAAKAAAKSPAAVWEAFGCGEGEVEGEAARGPALAPATATAPPPAHAVVLRLPARCAHVAWHVGGDYFSSTSPGAGGRAVGVHRLSSGGSQAPFRKLKGRAAVASWHPTRPALLVSAGAHVRVYDLAAQALAKKLVGGSGGVATVAVHPRGEHVLVGSADARLAWFDLDLSAKPHRVLRYHKAGLTAAAFHPTYPLLASAANDGAAHVFHGTVYADLMTDPLIVPLKALAAHGVTRAEGALALAWHPGQPWLVTAGADGAVCVWTDV